MYEDLKNFSDKDLALRILGYVDRIQEIMDEVGDFLSDRSKVINRSIILAKYKSIKTDIKNDAHYVDLLRNENRRNRLYHTIFIPSISEASAWGFTVPTNANIDFKFFSSLEEARYKLTKYYSYDEWEKIAGQ